MKRIVIVGGVAGGMSAATRLRRLDANASITVLERSGYVSYANCGLPYYLGGVIAQESSLLLQTPESLHARFRLDVRVHSEVTSVDPAAQIITVTNLASGDSYTLDYDELILSPGATPIVPPIPGVGHALTLRTVEDVQRITEAVRKQPANAVVIGGGFIGVEAAENLAHRGIRTTLIEATNQLLAPLDPEMASPVADEMRAHGVDVKLGVSVVEIGEDSVRLSDGQLIPAELTLLAIGVRPDTTLARIAGLAVGPRGGIATDGDNRSSDPHIFAIGDAAEKRDALDGEPTLVPLANVANRQGRRVADTIMGLSPRPINTQGTAIVKVFDLTIASTGWNEKRLRAQGRDVVAIHTHAGSHAGYYPGAQTMALKLLIDPRDGSIVGAQGVGRDGIDKRIDVLATAIRAGVSAVELADLELAYAPPFGSAKDPVNMLGYIAENVLSGASPTVGWCGMDEEIAAGTAVIDVRSELEYARGHIPGAINISLDQLRERMSEIRGRRVIVSCQVGQRGHSANMFLRAHGYDSFNLDGGYLTWQASPAAQEHAVLPWVCHAGAA